ncbi:MAG TPA: energy transducer TonB [Candidatus Binatia bacterium]|nr:energy transducer TonB [Candidatus Binatia bacterium]
MNRKISLFLIAAVYLFVSAAGTLAGQNSDHSERKIVSRASPDYPELARRNRIGGSVRLELMVEPNGTVKSAKVLGGNPVLIHPAEDAARKWRFEAGSESTEIIQITFDPN